MITPGIVVTPSSVHVQSLFPGVSFVEGIPMVLSLSHEMWVASPYLLHFALVVRYLLSVLKSSISVKVSASIPLLLHPVELSPSVENGAYLCPGAFSAAAVLPGSSLLTYSSGVSSLQITFDLSFPVQVLGYFLR